MIMFDGSSYEPYHISTPKTDVIYKVNFSSTIFNNLV